MMPIASRLARPVNSPESTSVPAAGDAASSVSPLNAASPSGYTTTRTGRPYFRANSKSR